MGLSNIQDVSIGKFIEMKFDPKLSKDEVVQLAEQSCKKLLANPNTEQYSYEIMDEE